MTDPEVQHGISKMMNKKQCFSLKEKKLQEKFLGALACEPEHDSQVILIFSLFDIWDFYKKNYYKKKQCKQCIFISLLSIFI